MVSTFRNGFRAPNRKVHNSRLVNIHHRCGVTQSGWHDPYCGETGALDLEDHVHCVDYGADVKANYHEQHTR